VSDRGQLVVLAAALVVVALLPMLAAYLQLGYHPASDRGAVDRVGSAERALQDAVDGPAVTPTGANWSERRDAAAAVRRALRPTLAAVRAAARPDATVTLRFNDTAASRVAARACPDGPNRRFGDCASAGGVVVQSRANRTHLVAVAVDVVRSTADGRSAATLVVWR
jgi:hypothetical protein